MTDTSSEAVERFWPELDWLENDYCGADMQKDPDGDWVRYSDFAALAAKLAEAEAWNRNQEEIIHSATANRLAAEAALAIAREHALREAATETHVFAREEHWHPYYVTKLVTRILALIERKP